MLTAEELLKAIEAGTLEAEVSCDSPNKGPEFTLMVNKRFLAKLRVSGNERPRASLGTTVHVVAGPQNSDGFTIECSSNCDAFNISIAIDTCLIEALQKFDDLQHARQRHAYNFWTAWGRVVESMQKKGPQNDAESSHPIDPA